jgi:hypothetical protein
MSIDGLVFRSDMVRLIYPFGLPMTRSSFAAKSSPTLRGVTFAVLSWLRI